MKVIKEASTKKGISVETTRDEESIVEQMERDWPEMTSEFKKIQQEQYELLSKNIIMTIDYESKLCLW